MKQTIEQRFWAKVSTDGPLHPYDPTLGPCWVWTAATNSRGYGLIAYEGGTLAHRLAYLLEHGAIPDGLFVCHTCDNPPCVRPAHLYAGTRSDNAADILRQGRWGPGEQMRARTHCPSGHAYDEANTYRYSTGHRRCRACGKAQTMSSRCDACNRENSAALRRSLGKPVGNHYKPPTTHTCKRLTGRVEARPY